MSRIERVDLERASIAVGRDLKMTTVPNRPGPPQRIDGLALGIADMTRPPPHNGEMHPDGDEFVVVLSGRAALIADSAADAPLELTSGDACIIRKGEWHRFRILEPVRLLYLTPGPNSEHRPLKEGQNDG